MFDFFDKIFDFDKNGRLDPFEESARDATFLEIIEEGEKHHSAPEYQAHAWDEEEDEEDKDIFDLDDDDEDEDDTDYSWSSLDSEQIEELEDAGIDVEDFEYLDDDDKREMLEDYGLDPDDYDL